jgi:hypothetical protein
MSRQRHLEGHDALWHDLAWAGVAAAAVTLLLVAAVAVVWLLGRSPAATPQPLAAEVSTPTPRTLVFGHATPTPVPTARTAKATPEARSASAGESAGAAPYLEAPDKVAFSKLAAGSWQAEGKRLINPGESATAERWLTLVTVPQSSFAIEAEIHVESLLQSVCDQSFGLAGGSATAGPMMGGGILFPCGSESPRAGLTDVLVWQDGYNADPVVAEKAFDPGDGWHTYRFEVRGDRMRLLVDGVAVVSGRAKTPLDPTDTDLEAGLWSQGAGIEVRHVSVLPLPAG